MRNGQNKRMRGRNRKSQNPLTRVYESNGPDVKIRGTANHIAEKYIQLARDAQGSGDPVAAENYYQHAEHYFRLIASAQEQFRQANPYFQGQAGDNRDDDYEGEDEGQPIMGPEPGFVAREQPQFQPRESQPYPTREPQPTLPRDVMGQGNRPPQNSAQPEGELERLPSFITGGQPQPSGAPVGNGHENGQQERYGMHRRRRRHRGPRGDLPGGAPQLGDDGGPQPGGE